MAIVGTRSWLILGVVVVGGFSLVADDLNDWFHRRVTAEHLKTNGAAQTAEPASPQDRQADGGAAGAPAQSSNVAAQDRAPAASGQDGDDQSAKRVSQAELRAETPGRPLDRAPSEAGRREAAANVGPGVDGGAAHAAARTTNLAVQDQAAPADRQVAQAEPSADATREAQAGGVAHAPAEKPAIADAEQPADATAGVGAGASARSNDVASADKTATESRENSEASSQRDVTAQAPSQPLDQAPAEAPRRDAVANADVQAGGANADAAARSASEQTASQSGQNSEASQRDVTAQAPSQPLDQAPAEAPRRDAVANADVQAGGANADAAARSASEQTASQSGQNSEASQRDVTAQAPSQPLDQAPAEAPRRDAVANADVQAGGANADAAARSASEQTASQSGQNSEASQRDVTAQAPSQPLDQAPAEAPRRDAVTNADAQAGGANADAAARSASEQTASQSGQNSEASQKDVTAQAPSQPLDQASAEAPRRDAVANADAQAGGANADAAARSASEQTASQSGQNSEASQRDVTAQAPSQPLDQAPAEAPRRDAVTNADAQAGGANADAAARSASEQTASQSGQNSEASQRGVTAQAPSQPLDQAPAEAPRRDAVTNADAQAGGANARIDAKSNDKAPEQTATLRGQHSEPAQSDVTAQAPLQPRDHAAVEVAGRGQTGTDPRQPPEACGRLDGAQRQQCIDRLPQLGPHSGVLQAIGGDRWVISETTSPIDYSPAVTASILLQSGASRLKLSIYCRRGRTDLELAGDRPDTYAAWRDIVVTHSINRAAPIEQRWEARGSVAFFKGDVVAFLRSLQDGSELAVRVSDGTSVLHEGRFVLDGLSQVRDKFGSACKWPEADDRAVAAAKSAEVAAGQQTRSEQAQKDMTAQPLRDAPSQPRSDAAVKVAGRAQSGTDAQLQPEACGRLDDAQRQECVGQLSKLGALKATGGDRWVISETTSPVDYSPIVTASILLQSGASRLKLSIICRRGRTHLELASDRPDTAAAGSGRDIVVTHSINREASIEQRWDARGSVASFRGDAVAFLRSLPDDGELAVRVSDGKSVLHEGRFVLDGLSHVRDRFASACKWPGAGAVPPSQAERGTRKTSKKGNTQ